jgi:hypothetical protein
MEIARRVAVEPRPAYATPALLPTVPAAEAVAASLQLLRHRLLHLLLLHLLLLPRPPPLCNPLNSSLGNAPWTANVNRDAAVPRPVSAMLVPLLRAPAEEAAEDLLPPLLPHRPPVHLLRRRWL